MPNIQEVVLELVFCCVLGRDDSVSVHWDFQKVLTRCSVATEI